MTWEKEEPMEEDRRRHTRFETAIPVHFNLNPDYHHVPEIRKLGVGATVRNLSPMGLLIDSRMDLLDMFQVFPEAMEERSPFELEVVVREFRGKRLLLRGSVKWYRLGEPEGSVWHLLVGLHLRDAESRIAARGILESITKRDVRAFGTSQHSVGILPA
jgi:hypothetical protein